MHDKRSVMYPLKASVNSNPRDQLPGIVWFPIDFTFYLMEVLPSTKLRNL